LRKVEEVEKVEEVDAAASTADNVARGSINFPTSSTFSTT